MENSCPYIADSVGMSSYKNTCTGKKVWMRQHQRRKE
jgi:hypothetical protein